MTTTKGNKNKFDWWNLDKTDIRIIHDSIEDRKLVHKTQQILDFTATKISESSDLGV